MKRIIVGSLVILWGANAVAYGIDKLLQHEPVWLWGVSFLAGSVGIIAGGITILFGAKIRDVLPFL